MSLRFFVFGSRTVLPDGHHSGIMAVSMCRSLNPFFNAFCAFSNFFQQKFWMPSIPGAVQFYRLGISFFIFSSVMANSLTRFALSASLAFTFSIHSKFCIGSICSQMPPQISTNLCISGMSPSRFSTASRVGKEFLVSLEHNVSSDCVFQGISPTSPSCNETYQAIAP